jgi:hypothetical protein
MPPPPPPDDGRYVFLCGAGKVGTMLSWSRLTYDYVSISPAHATPHPSHLTLPYICTLGSQYTILLFYLPYCNGFLNTSLWSFLKVPVQKVPMPPSFLTVAGTSFVFPYYSSSSGTYSAIFLYWSSSSGTYSAIFPYCSSSPGTVITLQSFLTVAAFRYLYSIFPYCSSSSSTFSSIFLYCSSSSGTHYSIFPDHSSSLRIFSNCPYCRRVS